jgi:hypothetical protein
MYVMTAVRTAPSTTETLSIRLGEAQEVETPNMATRATRLVRNAATALCAVILFSYVEMG